MQGGREVRFFAIFAFSAQMSFRDSPRFIKDYVVYKGIL